jgi:hypothetical protein
MATSRGVRDSIWESKMRNWRLRRRKRGMLVARDWVMRRSVRRVRMVDVPGNC